MLDEMGKREEASSLPRSSDEALNEKGASDDPGLERVASVSTWIYEARGEGIEKKQWVIREQPVTLYLNGKEMVTLLCAGHHLDELAVGFLRAEGFLQAPEDLEDLQVDEASGRVSVTARSASPLVETMWEKRTVTSGCGKGSLFYFSLDALLARPVRSDLRVTPSQIVGRVEDLHRLSETYRRTHGVHNSVLATPEKIVIFRDDIGRHNAVDMIVGHVFLNSIPLQDKLLITTGRLTSEILIKTAKMGIPVLVSRNTATTLAIQLAQSLNVTLVGYARAGKFTVYSGRERIATPKA